jgi:hypothetical protein
MSDFGVDVSNWVEKAGLNNEEVVRATALKLFTSIIVSSPIDEGTFRNNWFLSGVVPSAEVNPTDNAGSDAGAIAEMTSDLKKLKLWENITLTNNLPYARVIEYGGYIGSGPNTVGGFSKQAPQGVVRVNAVRFQNIINEEAAKVR